VALDFEKLERTDVRCYEGTIVVKPD